MSYLSNQQILDKHRQTREHLEEQIGILRTRINQATSIFEITELTNTLHQVEDEISVVIASHPTRGRDVYLQSSIKTEEKTINILTTANRLDAFNYKYKLQFPGPVNTYPFSLYVGDDFKIEPLFHPGTKKEVDGSIVNYCVCAICSIKGHSEQYHEEYIQCYA